MLIAVCSSRPDDLTSSCAGVMIAVITQRALLFTGFTRKETAGSLFCGFTLCGGQSIASATSLSCASVKRLRSTVWFGAFAACV